MTNKIKIISVSMFLVSCGISEQFQGIQDSVTSSDSTEFTSLLNEYDLTDDGTSISGEETATLTELSEDANAVLTQIVAIRTGIRAELDLICSPDQDLIDTVQAELQAIYVDDTLTEAEKRAAARAVKDTYMAALQADRAVMKQCIADNQAAWDAVKLTFDPIQDACLLERGSWNRGHRHGGRGQGGLDSTTTDTTTTDDTATTDDTVATDDTSTDETALSFRHGGRSYNPELIAEFEAKLVSDACALAIAEYPGTDSVDDSTDDTVDDSTDDSAEEVTE